MCETKYTAADYKAGQPRWCPGCGDHAFLNSFHKALAEIGIPPHQIAVISGIGCSSRAAGYMNYNTLHTTHGRAIAFATGVKLANPDLHVIVITGDGDATAIGGNHLIHACRRNIDLTVIVFNNNIYGMTGGQYSPTTPHGEKGTTAPYGNIDYNFDIPQLAQAAGATFTGRCTAYHAQQAIKLIEAGIRHHGFSLIEGLSVCPTYYGRKNKKGDSVKMLTWQKDNAVDVKAAAKMTPEQLEGKFLIGELSSVENKEEYTDMYMKIIEKVGGDK